MASEWTAPAVKAATCTPSTPTVYRSVGYPVHRAHSETGAMYTGAVFNSYTVQCTTGHTMYVDTGVHYTTMSCTASSYI